MEQEQVVPMLVEELVEALQMEQAGERGKNLPPMRAVEYRQEQGEMLVAVKEMYPQTVTEVVLPVIRCRCRCQEGVKEITVTEVVLPVICCRCQEGVKEMYPQTVTEVVLPVICCRCQEGVKEMYPQTVTEVKKMYYPPTVTEVKKMYYPPTVTEVKEMYYPPTVTEVVLPVIRCRCQEGESSESCQR